MSKTNRTQIIDKMDNKQLALYLAYGAHIVDGDIDTANLIDIDDKTRAEIAKNSIEIEKWLSEKAKPGTAEPNATKYYWELTKTNADFEEAFYYFTTDFMFDEEYIHLSDHDYEYDLVLFKDDEEIEGMSGYYIEYEELPQDIKDMLNEFIVRKE